ncbi:MAG: DUF4190 domain-containing protein [Arthrobacter sp.]|jgi:hypothetical protein|nr:DUF4190 domain-containing protein [Arthrobacter sp.]
MSIPPRDSFENASGSQDWASQQPEGDRSWATPDPSKDPANPYGRSDLFGDAAPAVQAFPAAPPTGPQPAPGDPYAAQGFPATPGYPAAPQANPYAQPYAVGPQYGPPYGQPMPQQPYPQQFTPYGAPTYQAPPARGLSITGMVLGIASVLFGWVFFLPPIAGVVFSILGLIKEPRGKGMAITGLILSGLGVLFWLFLVFVGGWWSDVTPYSDGFDA